MNIFRVLSTLLLCCFASMTAVAADTQAVIDALNSPGHVALMRHAIAPGGGDPDNFVLRDCTTQRNLSDAGRTQARETGKFLRANGVATLRVHSSQWCRCLETARLLGYGELEELPFLNSFFQKWDRKALQTGQLMQWLKTADLTAPAILVTHQVNITGLTDVFPASGEIVVIKVHADAPPETVGTLRL